MSMETGLTVVAVRGDSLLLELQEYYLYHIVHLVHY